MEIYEIIIQFNLLDILIVEFLLLHTILLYIPTYIDVYSY